MLSGVSEPTVSRVLNGRNGVATSTRDRVVAALSTLGFDHVPEPRDVRRGVIGLVCGEFENPVFATHVHHISTALGRKAVMSTVAVTDPDYAPEDRCIDELERSGVDGFVFIGGRQAEIDGDHSHYERLVADDRPMVFVNGAATGIDRPHIWCDEAAGARQAVSHLLALGHTQIGCLLGPPKYVATQRFITGYRSVMADAGLPEPADAIVDATFTLEGGRAGAARLIDRGITAMIAGNDLMALGAVLATKSDSSSGRIAVIGYDGTSLTAFTDPPLTTLRQPFEDMAQLIADAILSEIDMSNRFRDNFVFEPQLVVRDSARSFGKPMAPTQT
jgi:DNA-binding LacI/PurR family transcriptional regulator